MAMGSDSGAEVNACICEADSFRTLSWLSLRAVTFGCARAFVGELLELGAGVAVGVSTGDSRSGNGTVAIDDVEEVLVGIKGAGSCRCFLRGKSAPAPSLWPSTPFPLLLPSVSSFSCHLVSPPIPFVSTCNPGMIKALLSCTSSVAFLGDVQYAQARIDRQ